MKERTSSHFFMRLLPLALLPAGFIVAGRRGSALTDDRDREVPPDSLQPLAAPAAEAPAAMTKPELEDPPLGAPTSICAS